MSRRNTAPKAACIRVLSLPETELFFWGQTPRVWWGRGDIDVDALLSIGDVDSDEPWFVTEAEVPALRIEFDDKREDRPTGPDPGDVATIIAFLQDVLPEIDDSGCVLIHCNWGFSRSTAAALIAWMLVLGPGAEEDAVARVLADRPIAKPNATMVKYADEQLALDGQLVAATAHLQDRDVDFDVLHEWGVIDDDELGMLREWAVL